MRNDALRIPVLASCAIHIFILLLCSMMIHENSLPQRNFIPINLVELARPENPSPQKKIEAPQIKKQLPPPPKVDKPKPPSQIAKVPVAKPEVAPLPAPIKEEPAKANAQAVPPLKTEPPPGASSAVRSDDGGSEAGAGELYGGGDAGVIPGTGTAGGDGGTAVSGSGRGTGAPGLPAEPVVKTNRNAKPIQIVRAAYPPMALRMGMESDVTLRIEVDPTGSVTKAEITKSGGTGFDEEALKAVKQSRFEPAQREGRNVPAEFAYVYRFRLRK
jgi:periplasmic protein TonB